MYTAIFFLLFIVSASIAVLFVTLFIAKKKESDEYFEEFKDVIDIDKETKKYQKELEDKRRQYEKFVGECIAGENKLKSSYSQKRSVYENLVKEISLLEEQAEDLSYGLYEPHFNFDTSERYKYEIQNIRKQQKEMVREKNAAICTTEWTVSGSKSEGTKMTNRTMKLMLRAFNNECDAAVLKVNWNNVQIMKERIMKAYEAINKLGEPSAIVISPDYLEIKLKEISLAYEYQEKLQAEKEEQRRIREQMREEEKVRREIEKAMQDAIREEQVYNKALEEARQEMESAHGERLEKLKIQTALLEEKLKKAEEKGQRAQSMAEKTKSGHVYVISNIGSFGKNIYKIGLTRRLDPEIRVKELGDASVPFAFDIHAMIHSENAPELENAFHKHFRDKQLNLVNSRKEFFAVSLNEIEEHAVANGLTVEFTKIAEAKEYRETMAMLSVNNKEQQFKQIVNNKFPDSL
jgi:Domain of unknown function (DUF4041)/Meiotically up-regulated gene 113